METTCGTSSDSETNSVRYREVYHLITLTQIGEIIQASEAPFEDLFSNIPQVRFAVRKSKQHSIASRLVERCRREVIVNQLKIEALNVHSQVRSLMGLAKARKTADVYEQSDDELRSALGIR
jgi:hypothetical protein